MSTPRQPSFGTFWNLHAAGLSRMASILFDDPTRDPTPDLGDLMQRVKAQASSEWPAAPAAPEGWLRRLAGRECLGYGLGLYWPALRRVLTGQVWSDEMIDELVQGAATRAAERLNELIERPRPLFGWLRILVQQQRVDWLRSRSALKRDQGRNVPLDAAPRLADPRTTPTQAERRARVRELFDRVLAELPPDYSALLRLVADEQLTPAEIAVRLGIQPGDARVRLFRARRRAIELFIDRFPEVAADLADLGLIDPAFSRTTEP